MNLNGDSAAKWPNVRLEAAKEFKTTLGPVKVSDVHAVCWNIQAAEAGYHRLILNIDGAQLDKELAVGDGLMRVSLVRPEWSWSECS